MREWFYGSAFYRLTLKGKVPDGLRQIPADPWPGNPVAGESLMAGTFVQAGHPVTMGEDPWGAVAGQPDVEAKLHGFAWLSDLRALGSPPAKAKARALIADWLERHGRWHPVSWRADVLGERLANWFAAYEFLFGGCEEEEDPGLLPFLRSAAAQARHLARTIGQAPRDGRAFNAIKGMIAAALCLPGSEEGLATGVRLLGEETERQILADGGHFQRNPALHLAVLRHLLDLRALMQATQVEVPAFLQGGIDRMVPMLRAFRLGDGGLVLFNGGGEGHRAVIDAVLAQAGVKGRALLGARHVGFQRLSAGRTVVVMDAGGPPPPGADVLAHAGTLAFEMSVGAHRLIVNCGPYRGTDAAWAAAARATAAHSTVTVDDTNSSEIVEGGVGSRVARTTAIRRENDGATWLETSHDGYRGAFGLLHRRNLHLDTAGEALIGEDRLEGGRARAFTARFHLHPDVQASVVHGGEAVLLRLADGRGWQFQAKGGALSLEGSVYLGQNRPRRTEQIVVTGPAEGGAQLKWRLSRIAES